MSFLTEKERFLENINVFFNFLRKEKWSSYEESPFKLISLTLFDWAYDGLYKSRADIILNLKEKKEFYLLFFQHLITYLREENTLKDIELSHKLQFLLRDLLDTYLVIREQEEGMELTGESLVLEINHFFDDFHKKTKNIFNIKGSTKEYCHNSFVGNKDLKKLSNKDDLNLDGDILYNEINKIFVIKKTKKSFIVKMRIWFEDDYYKLIIEKNLKL